MNRTVICSTYYLCCGKRMPAVEVLFKHLSFPSSFIRALNDGEISVSILYDWLLKNFQKLDW